MSSKYIAGEDLKIGDLVEIPIYVEGEGIKVYNVNTKQEVKFYNYFFECKNCLKCTEFTIERGKTTEDFIKEHMDMKCENCGCIYFDRSCIKFEMDSQTATGILSNSTEL